MLGRSPPPGMNIVLAMQIENLVEYEAASIIVDKDIEDIRIKAFILSDPIP